MFMQKKHQVTERAFLFRETLYYPWNLLDMISHVLFVADAQKEILRFFSSS